MKWPLFLSGAVAAAIGASGCGNDASPDVKIETVDGLLAKVCEVAAPCPATAPTQAEIDSCPLHLRSELSPTQLAALERFISYTKSQQDCIVASIEGAICSRFGGGLSSISDSDVLEPYLAGEQQCL